MQTDQEEAVIEMDQSKASKIFLAVFFLAIVLSIAVSYWRIVIRRDYDIVASVDCDPYEERCFVHICNPDPNVDGECTGDLSEDTWFTKNLNRKAYNIPECDPADENCTALQCGENEEGCFYELCGEANVPEGDSCNDPEQYTKDNPPEEESVCEEGDETCAANTDESDEAGVVCAEGDVECTATAANSDEEPAVAADSACDGNAGAVCPVAVDGEK
jgi:hypothetical protein